MTDSGVQLMDRTTCTLCNVLHAALKSRPSAGQSLNWMKCTTCTELLESREHPSYFEMFAHVGIVEVPLWPQMETLVRLESPCCMFKQTLPWPKPALSVIC